MLSHFKRLQNIFNRRELIKLLAESEINENVTYSEFSIRRVSRLHDIKPVITRRDIDCQKSMFNNKTLQTLISQRNKLIEQLKYHDTEELRDKIIAFSKKQQDLQEQILKRYSVNL